MASRGASRTMFADQGWASPKQPQVELIGVPLWHKCDWSLEMPLGSSSWVRAEGNNVGIAVLLVLLHTLWCSPITLDLLWRAHSFLCMVLSSSSRASVSFCRHLVTTEPANQSGCPVVGALSLGLRTSCFWGVFAVYCGQVVLSQSTLYRAKKAQSFNAFLVTHSQRKQ